MKRSSAHHLILPTTRNRVDSIESFVETADDIYEGLLIFPEGWVPIIAGVPIFVDADIGDFPARWGLDETRRLALSTSLDQHETSKTFSDKWSRFTAYGFMDAHREFLFGWYAKKLGLKTQEDLDAFYRAKSRILEVGPGSGFNTRYMAEVCSGEVVSVDVSSAARTVYANTKDLANCTIVQADLMEAPFADGSFDFIIADGVLHHTPDTRAAVEALYRKLSPGGEFFFYVYRKMGAARQFCDAHIREHFTRLPPEECYAACEGLTELGRELSRLGAKITLDKPIPVLGIPAGTHDVQRLIYYNFVKCFWNEAFDYETNNMVNFDWYHPHNAWQHTQEEVAGWLRELGAERWAFHDSNPNGISVIVTKPSAAA